MLDTIATLPSAEELNARLLARYAAALDLATLRQLTGQRLSGLFVSAAGAGYPRSRARIMVVGRETMGWGTQLDSDLAKPERCGSVEAYLAQQMRFHQRKTAEVARRSKFFQFYREAARKVAAAGDDLTANAAVWANLFCFDAAGSRPDRTPRGAAIVALSLKLLRIQIAVLQPRVIVFATGTSCDAYLRDEFAERVDSQVHIPRRLWQFTLPPTAESSAVSVFRTPHPRHTASAHFRSAILEEALRPGALVTFLASLGHAAAMPLQGTLTSSR